VVCMTRFGGYATVVCAPHGSVRRRSSPSRARPRYPSTTSPRG
jgi:hypothetical protein